MEASTLQGFTSSATKFILPHQGNGVGWRVRCLSTLRTLCAQRDAEISKTNERKREKAREETMKTWKWQRTPCLEFIPHSLATAWSRVGWQSLSGSEGSGQKVPLGVRHELCYQLWFNTRFPASHYCQIPLSSQYVKDSECPSENFKLWSAASHRKHVLVKL